MSTRTLHRLARAMRAATAYDYLSPAEAARLVSGGGTATLAAEPATAAPASGPTAAWEGTLVFEGQMTGDGRLIEANALRWENLPIPLRWSAIDNGGHDGAQVVGSIDAIERGQGGAITARGRFDLGSEHGTEARRQVAEGLTTGVSVDLDDVSFEIRVAREVMDDMMGEPEPVPVETVEGEPGAEPTDADGRVTVVSINSDDEVMVTTDARIRAATMVAIPAFESARLAVTEEAPAAAGPDSAPKEERPAPEEPEEPEGGAPAALVAGAGPVRPPTAWFSDPGLSGPTPLTVTDDGRVYGHLALWGTCHTGFQGQCVSPPSSGTGYAYFRTGAVLTSDGSEVAVGPITMDTLHADTTRRLTAAAAIRHYEDTGRAVAYVASGEDAHGIWVAGAMRADATAEQVRALRASPLSGDWRDVGTGGLELVAALAVNMPGFPVPRTKALVASGSMRTLVAAGMVPPQRVLPPGTPGALSPDDLRYLKALAARERERERRATPVAKADLSTQAAALALRVRAGRYRTSTTNV